MKVKSGRKPSSMFLECAHFASPNCRSFENVKNTPSNQSTLGKFYTITPIILITEYF